MMMGSGNGGVAALSVVVFIGMVLCVNHATCKPALGGSEQGPEAASSAGAGPGSPGFHMAPGAQVEYENGIDLLRRFTRQTDPGNVNTKLCKYKKEPWSACDPQTKVRTRTYTLKRGDRAVCDEQKTIRKECKQKKEGGKKNKARGENKNGGNNQQSNKNNRERERPRKKNNHNNN